jgi:hypothetical protein
MGAEVWSVEDHLAAGTAASVALWRELEAVITGFGPVTLSVSKTTVTFKGPRRGFAGARPKGEIVVGYFDLMRPLGTEDPRITHVSAYERRLFVHQFRLSAPAELDSVFVGWLRDAYAVGCGAHVA